MVVKCSQGCGAGDGPELSRRSRNISSRAGTGAAETFNRGLEPAQSKTMWLRLPENCTFSTIFKREIGTLYLAHGAIRHEKNCFFQGSEHHQSYHVGDARIYSELESGTSGHFSRVGVGSGTAIPPRSSGSSSGAGAGVGAVQSFPALYSWAYLRLCHKMSAPLLITRLNINKWRIVDSITVIKSSASIFTSAVMITSGRH